MSKTQEWLTPEIKKLLGTVPDRVVAKKVGKSLTAIQRIRGRLGISTWSKKQCRPHKEPSDKILLLLGKVSDDKIAYRAGVSVHTVLNWRYTRRIPCKSKNIRVSRNTQLLKLHKLHGFEWTISQCAQAMRIHLTTVRYLSQDLGLKWKSHYRTRMNENLARNTAIVVLRDKGFRFDEIASIVNLSKQRCCIIYERDSSVTRKALE